MNNLFNWGWSSQFPTSNSEYGRMQKLPKPDPIGSFNYGGYGYDRGNQNYGFSGAGNADNGQQNNFGYGNMAYGDNMQMPQSQQMHGYPAGGYGHQHQPSCPNYQLGQNAYSTQQLTSGIYDTGGNSANDFQVLVGDAAAAELAKNGSGPQGSGDFTQTYAPQQQQQQTQVQASGDTQNTGESCDQPMDKPKQPAMSTKEFVKMTGLRPQKEPKHPIGANNMSMSHQYSSTRTNPRLPKTPFHLCGKCQKCQMLKDPKSEINQKAAARAGTARLYKAPIPSALASKSGKKKA